MIDDSELEQVLYSPVCTFCKHLQEFRKCAAFPDRIPDAIWNGENDHTQPFDGDRGIRFERQKVE